MSISVLLADDQPLLRRGFRVAARLALDSAPDEPRNEAIA